VTLAPETRLGPYRVVRLLGAGGMGEVYEARDTRLDRTVAVKILHSHLSSNEALRERFDREARAISSLAHPHICALYDVGVETAAEGGGATHYLVMEYLEGEPLSERVMRGPLPIEQVLRIGVEIAEALDKAHRQGIVHRDLKPGNIMMTRSGSKLLDFGLVKYRQPEEVSLTGATLLRSEKGPLTQEGTLLGTFQYMAPEQLEGHEADARTDIFALGTVLYESATGRRAFQGTSRASLIAAIVAGTPTPMSQIAPMTPPAFDRIVQVCLAKDPDDRWQSAHDVAEELRWIAQAGSQAGVAGVVATRRRTRERLWIGAAAAAAVVAIALGAMLWRGRSVEARPVVASIIAPPNTKLDLTQYGASSLTLSPDGTLMTFAATSADGKRMLWVRRLDNGASHVLPGTENAQSPFWSPDSRFLAFFGDGKLRKMDVAGGPAVTLAAVADGRGGTWGKDGTILFTPNWRMPIYKIPPGGGTPVAITKVDEAHGETTHRWPVFLPDGKHFLYLAGSHRAVGESELNAIYYASLGSPERTLLIRSPSNVAVGDGHLLFVRDHSLMAQPFDASKGTLTGEPLRVIDEVSQEPGFFRAVFAVSNEGTLAYLGSASMSVRHLSWIDATGRETPINSPPAVYGASRVSPDGKRAVVEIGDPSDIWIVDLAHGTRTRMTFDPLNDYGPVWSPDGKEILFGSDRTSFLNPLLYRKRVDGLTPERPLPPGPSQSTATDWSPDGRYIVLNVNDPKNPTQRSDIWLYPLTGNEKPAPFISGEFMEAQGSFSPDMKWFAYLSNESGQQELYAVPFPGRGEKRQLSSGGITDYVWPRQGAGIYYRAASDQTVTFVPYAGGQFGEAKPLFKFAATPIAIDSVDGQHFLAVVPQQSETPPITLVTNWTKRPPAN
jgi:Tol biopolymer transport system component/predicted Ser/Thr protein kinase